MSRTSRISVMNRPNFSAAPGPRRDCSVYQLFPASGGRDVG
jgi:hypothetical protein